MAVLFRVRVISGTNLLSQIDHLESIYISHSLLKRIQINFYFISDTNSESIFEWSFKTENCFYDICLKFKFQCTDNDGIDTTLNLKYIGAAKCALKGSFEGYDNKEVAVSSRDCPIFTKKSIFQMSFSIPEICSTYIFFEE